MKPDENITFIRDVESCFIWLNKQLELTPAEKAILSKIPSLNAVKNKPDATVRNYIIECFNRKTALDLSKELDIPTVTIYKIWQYSGFNINSSAKMRKLSNEQVKQKRGIYKTTKKYKILSTLKSANIKQKDLNDTEFDILSLIAKGYTDIQIKNELKKSLAHIKNCIHSIYEKLDLTNETYPVRRVRAVLLYNEIIDVKRSHRLEGLSK